MDAPEIEISDIEFPDEAEYNDNFKIGFLLGKSSFSIPKNAAIAIKQNNFENQWTVEELPEGRKFVVNMEGKNLRKGPNEFAINVKFEDANGKKYETEEKFAIELVNVTFVQNILLAFNQFILFLGNLVP